MDLDLLKTFLELNRTRHFGKAAKSLFLTQSAVSSRLKLLESQLNVTLFERATRDMRLTPEGERLVKHAERLLADWEVARQDVSAMEAEFQILFGGSIQVWDAVLVQWLNDIRVFYPDIAIISELHSVDDLTKKLLDGSLDVAIMLEPLQVDVLKVMELNILEFICVSGYKDLHIDKALHHDFIYVDWGMAHDLAHRRAFPDAPEAMTRLPEPRMAISHMLALGGSCYLPTSAVKGILDRGRLHRVIDAPTFERQVYAAYHRESAREEVIIKCLGLIDL